ncbi:MAG TPA: preprotein translocase subunit SecG [Patescibacteria group bacterium]|nr:preprotein translocase subunit SecG [Patescibacteria group bacterium]
MKQVLTIFQIVVSVALIIVILIQARGTGLGRTFGGGSGTSFSRRGLEKLIFRLTFILVGLFLIVSILQLVI